MHCDSRDLSPKKLFVVHAVLPSSGFPRGSQKPHPLDPVRSPLVQLHGLGFEDVQLVAAWSHCQDFSFRDVVVGFLGLRSCRVLGRSFRFLGF